MAQMMRQLEYICKNESCKALRLSCCEHCPACGEPRFTLRLSNGKKIQEPLSGVAG